MALQDSSVRRRVDALQSSASSDHKSRFVRQVLKSLVDSRALAADRQWTGCSPQPRVSSSFSLWDCVARDLRWRSSAGSGCLRELIAATPSVTKCSSAAADVAKK